MIIDRVNFNEEEVSRMTKEDFEERHIGILWQDRDEKVRKKMLADAYDRISGNSKKKGQKSES